MIFPLIAELGLNSTARSEIHTLLVVSQRWRLGEPPSIDSASSALMIPARIDFKECSVGAGKTQLINRL